MRETRIYRGTVGHILMPSESEAGIKPRPSRREMKISGANVGLFKWHYFTASDVRSYTVTRDVKGDWTMVAFLQSPDAYKMAQKPLRFVAPVKDGEWVWVVDEITVRDGRCTATLYPPLT